MLRCEEEMVISSLLIFEIQFVLRYDRLFAQTSSKRSYPFEVLGMTMLYSDTTKPVPGSRCVGKISNQDLPHVASGYLPPRYCAYRILQQ